MASDRFTALYRELVGENYGRYDQIDVFKIGNFKPDKTQFMARATDLSLSQTANRYVKFCPFGSGMRKPTSYNLSENCPLYVDSGEFEI